MIEPQHPSTTSPQPPDDDPTLPQRPQFFVRVSPPYITRILLGANLLVFVAMIIYGVVVYDTWNGTQNVDVLIDFGAKYTPMILQGETWRLLTAMFLHIGVIHLLFNLYALFALGPLVEGYFGHWRFAAIYFLGGLFGSLASYAFSPAISAGASGAIFGLAGAITVYFLRYRDNFGARGRAILQNMLVVIGINLVFGLSMSGIDNWGHMGGLVGGALVAWGLLPRYRTPQIVRYGAQELESEPRTTLELAWVALATALLIFGVQAAGNLWMGRLP